MIIGFFGNVGSGKTAMMVRQMYKNKRKCFSNVETKFHWETTIEPEMIIKKELVKTIKKKDGSHEPVYNLKLNEDYWKTTPKPIDIYLDEFHNMMNSRRSMSKVNVIMGDFLALIRRIVGDTNSIGGNLYISTQLTRRADSILKDMMHQCRYHRCHYVRVCEDCMDYWKDNTDNPEQIDICRSCGSSRLFDFRQRIEVWHFSSAEAMELWRNMGLKTFHRHYKINDITKYFKYYDTMQWKNLVSRLYQ